MSTQHNGAYCPVNDKMVLTKERAAVVARTVNGRTYACEHCGGHHVTHPRKKKFGKVATRQRNSKYDRTKEKVFTKKFKP